MSKQMKFTAPSLGEKPHQPHNFKFPKREFGKQQTVKRSFQPQWFSRFSWLHYVEEGDLAFCFVCNKAYLENKLHSVSNLEHSYISTGYTNWKDATAKFPKHELSNCHKDAVLKVVTLPATTRDIGESLCTQYAEERLVRRQCFLKLMSSLKYLARQGLPLRGSGTESDSNYMQLLYLRAEDDARITDWIRKKTDKYTSGDMQNEMLKVMALTVLRKVALSLQQTNFYTVMVDETTDVNNSEQVVLCLRWIDNEFEAHEEFIGLYEVEKIDANTIFLVIKDVLQRLNLAVCKIRGQCYDGAATMSGHRSGVATKLLDEEPKAIYTHCYGHSLNLACGDTIKKSKIMKDSLDTTYEITKLIKKSPRRNRCFDKIKAEMAPDTAGVRMLCPTRWTVRADALQSILNNYEVLQELWIESHDFVKDTEMKARICGVESQMKTFNFLFGLVLGDLILRHSDNLSRTLQKTDISAAEGQEVANLTKRTLQSLRCDSMFDLFWEKITNKGKELQVSDPSLPRQRRIPRRLDEGSSEHEYPATPKDYFRRIYFEALDLIINCITDRFDQPGFRVYRNIEQLILKAAKNEDYGEEFDCIVGFYDVDFNPALLKTQLQVLSSNFYHAESRIFLSDITKFFKSLTSAQQEIFSEVCKLFRLLLVMPATNAVSERSFSALRRIKTYLRSTMSQVRLNHLLTLHIHRELTDKLDIIAAANEFLCNSEHREQVFGKFKCSDLNK